MFRSPAALFWMAPSLLLALGCLTWAAARRRRLTREFGQSQTLARLTRPEAPGRRKIKSALMISALVMAFLALAGPQWGVRLVESRSMGTQIMIAVDTSVSMLAEDLKPNRIERAKNALSLMIDGMKGNRVGLIAFAGEIAEAMK